MVGSSAAEEAMALFKDDTGEPDEFELRVRFGCGFAVGAVIGAASVPQLGDASVRAVVPAALGVGDRFWNAVQGWS